MSATLALRRAGVAVDLIDADPDWKVYGAGISMTGMALRALDDLGVLDEVRARGHVGSGMRGLALDGSVLFAAPALENPPPVQASGGIMRPVLHDILATQARASGAEIRLGCRVASFDDDGEGVSVRFVDGRKGRYDLVVGADGIYSDTGRLLFPDAPAPAFTGQGCWRAVVPRREGMTGTEMVFGGPVKLGFNPVSATDMYLFALEHVPDNPRYRDEDLVERLKALLEGFGGDVPRVREALGPQSMVNYRPLEWHILPAPWHKGRVVLIGDAAHATTPHMASGAGLAIEDGIVLAREVARQHDLDEALDAFVSHRFERARLVVENSVRIGQIEMTGGDQVEANHMLGSTLAMLQQPY
jgi:2-polyprenyl-6-methoxyphenol hydroxylase-like FAD-dependent oxidoreductase